MKKLLLLFLLPTIMIYANPNPDAVLGFWVGKSEKENRSSIIKIYKKENGTYAGKIVKLINPDYTVDIKNKDKTLKNRNLVGIDLIFNFTFFEKDEEYKNGKIYNPEDGKTYYAKLKVTKEGTLDLRGSIDPLNWLGKTVKWYRPNETLLFELNKYIK